MILSVFVLVGLLASSAASSAVKGIAQERIEEHQVKGGLGRQLQPADYLQRTQQQHHYEQRAQVAYPAKGQPEAYPSEQAKLADSDLYQQREETKSERQQFYEAQPQLRESADSKLDSGRRSSTQAHISKVEERIEEQTKLEDYSQQREEAPAQPVKGVTKLDYRPEATRAQQEVKQVREEVAAAPAKSPAKVEQVANKVEERREEQVQYIGQAPEEQPQQRYEAQRHLDQTELQQQQVELNRDYEQRRYEEPTEQRQSFSGQVREEQLVKGGLRAPGAEAEPYAFDYSVEGSSRRESGDQNGVVRGQYTLQNPDGTQRVVDYVADQDGFRAQVRTNEFGTEGHQQQAAAVRSAPQLDGKTYQQTQELTRVAVVSQAVKSAPEKTTRSQPIYQEEKSAGSAFKLEAAKGAVEVRAAAASVHEPEPAVQRAAPETIKSAELRGPKAIGYRSSPIVTRASGFESATAHHQHLTPVVHSHPAPVPVVAVRHQPVPVVRHQILSPARGHHVVGYQQSGLRHTHPVVVHGGLSRSQLQHDRYPPASYRREQPANPHVSFYAHHNHEDEQPAGFEHPADLI